MDRVLHLTTGHMTGQDVKDAQWLLQGHNVFKTNWHPGAVDGEFGPHVVGASVRAKWALGYPKRLTRGTFGQKLYDFLDGKKKLPLAYRLRRKARLKRAASVPRRLKVLKLALTQRGVKESPAGSNRVKYSLWYHVLGPWCAMFVSWLYHQFGSTFHYAYVPSIVHDARVGRNGLSVTHHPLPGDVVCYDWTHDGTADHTGIFDEWYPHSVGEFTAIEGNTALGNDSNGGEVMMRARNVGQVQVFVHVNR